MTTTFWKFLTIFTDEPNHKGHQIMTMPRVPKYPQPALVAIAKESSTLITIEGKQSARNLWHTYFAYRKLQAGFELANLRCKKKKSKGYSVTTKKDRTFWLLAPVY